MTETTKSQQDAQKAQAKAVVREWIESIVIALVLAMFIRTFFIQPFKIPSGSMRKTLIEGDRLFVSKFRYGAKVPFTDWRLPGIGQPERGDVIVFIYPNDRSKDFIKRLIAKGGETVEIKDGQIYVNDKQVDIPQIKKRYYYNRGDFGGLGEKIHVPLDSYFVLGDNSGSSHDSRYWGFVPKKDVIGKAEFIFWPLNRIRVIK